LPPPGHITRETVDPTAESAPDSELRTRPDPIDRIRTAEPDGRTANPFYRPIPTTETAVPFIDPIPTADRAQPYPGDRFTTTNPDGRIRTAGFRPHLHRSDDVSG